jgi:hypothetical protein
MTSKEMTKLKFPIGMYQAPASINQEHITDWVRDIEFFPKRVEEITRGLEKDELNWRYRPDGWTIKEVVHHCVDSHMNSIIRFKLTLTENEPTIRPYFEDRWAGLVDSQDDNISHSLALLKALHHKWVMLLKSVDKQGYKRTFIHPEYDETLYLDWNIGLYAWHCRHHYAHIVQALDAQGKYNT